ncbi:MAG: TauD/TfdA family dioxygenase, partial [Rhodospirillales bacterium]|nr:TauD/TfdA family dioxygenase [Rhodospirillales bacterium]
MTRQPLTGRVAWRGSDLRDTDWTRALTPAQVGALDRALQAVNQRRIPTLSITRQDFPLEGFDALVADIQDELENGLGFLRITGFDADRYAIDDLKRLWWGLGTHLGVAVNQAGYGEMIGEVRDESFDANPTFVTAGAGEVKTSRARARSTGPLRFHTDRCDVIGLLCARNSMTGGVSKITSSVTIHNEILQRRPDLLDVLYQDFWRSRPADEDGVHGRPCFPLPVFAQKDGKFTSQYSRTYVEQAQENPDVPRLTPAQVEAMDLLAEVAEEVCLHAPF